MAHALFYVYGRMLSHCISLKHLVDRRNSRRVAHGLFQKEIDILYIWKDALFKAFSRAQGSRKVRFDLTKNLFTLVQSRLKLAGKGN